MAKQNAGGEKAKRLDGLYSSLSARGVDGVVLDRRDDQFYFTGYTGSDAVLVLAVKKRRGWLITDTRYTEEAEKTAPGVETLVWKGGFARFTGDLLRRNRLKKIAHTPHSLSAAFFLSMRDAAAPGAAWEDAGPDIAKLRAVKSASEVKAIEKALACAEAAFLTSKKRWKIYMAETEVKNDLEWEMRRRGAEDAAFETIVAVGANASLPHAHAGSRKIRGGKMLLIDFGARVDRYNSDLTRTLWAGEVPAVWRKRYEAVLAAQRAGTAAIREGIPGIEVDAAARSELTARKMEEYFTHGLGHGVGLAVHEEPRLSRLYNQPLESGNIVTVEPGVYFPGSGGIRVEDMVLVGKGGGRVLSTLRRELEDMIF